MMMIYVCVCVPLSFSLTRLSFSRKWLLTMNKSHLFRSHPIIFIIVHLIDPLAITIISFFIVICFCCCWLLQSRLHLIPLMVMNGHNIGMIMANRAIFNNNLIINKTITTIHTLTVRAPSHPKTNRDRATYLLVH